MAGNCSTTSAGLYYIRVIFIVCAVPVALSYAWMSSENDSKFLPLQSENCFRDLTKYGNNNNNN